MKQIAKGPEPASFSLWKRTDRMAHRPRWRRVPAREKRAVHASLMREQGFLCCYCEARVTAEDSHVEHFRPREKFKDLQLVYDNLLCSCQRNRKGGEPRHCGSKKGSWFKEHLLVSPLEADCEERFRFTADGCIRPRKEEDIAAAATIRKLALDLPKLREFREAAVDALLNDSPSEIERLLGKPADAAFVPYYSTIKQVLGP